MEENWKKALRKTKGEVLEKLFQIVSNKKELARKLKRSKNTIKSAIRQLEIFGYVEDHKRIVYPNGKTINYAKKTNLNFLWDYWESRFNKKASKNDKEIIDFFLSYHFIREDIVKKYKEENILEKIKKFILEICIISIIREKRQTDQLRYANKDYIKRVLNFEDIEYGITDPKKEANLTINKVIEYLPFQFIIKILRMNLPYLAGLHAFVHPLKLIKMAEEELRKNKEYPFSFSLKNIMETLNEWNEYEEEFKGREYLLNQNVSFS